MPPRIPPTPWVSLLSEHRPLGKEAVPWSLILSDIRGMQKPTLASCGPSRWGFLFTLHPASYSPFRKQGCYGDSSAKALTMSSRSLICTNENPLTLTFTESQLCSSSRGALV